jgi:hypothetical protein
MEGRVPGKPLKIRVLRNFPARQVFIHVDERVSSGGGQEFNRL